MARHVRRHDRSTGNIVLSNENMTHQEDQDCPRYQVSESTELRTSTQGLRRGYIRCSTGVEGRCLRDCQCLRHRHRLYCSRQALLGAFGHPKLSHPSLERFPQRVAQQLVIHSRRCAVCCRRQCQRNVHSCFEMHDLSHVRSDPSSYCSARMGIRRDDRHILHKEKRLIKAFVRPEQLFDDQMQPARDLSTRDAFLILCRGISCLLHT